MAEDNKITTPSGMGGLQHFNEEYNSKLQIKPEWVVVLICTVIVSIGIIKFIY